MKLQIIGLIIYSISVFSCKEQSEVYELAKQSDKIQVVFYDNPSSYIDITKRSERTKFSKYISEEQTPYLKCDYAGAIIFFTEYGSVKMDFNLSDDCQHVIYSFGGEVETRKLTEEGLAHLKDLQSKLN
ncbi:MAG: hypothetical protein H0U27_05025 [Nitrosopumilus sp.]|nr:hypothetical protein [Nitrosopumilus sp.]